MYLRFAREATPVVTRPDTPWRWGEANVIRFRRRAPRFVDAFDSALASTYESEGEDLTIAACGPMVPEAMRAAWILKEQDGVEARVLNLHTIKPLDAEALRRAARETGLLLTAEEHQVGALGGIVAAAVATGKTPAEPFAMTMTGVRDRFGESGEPWTLMR
ncbi:MAG: transketolase C-terminal domain-containing protein, partial [bacterium]